MNMNHAWQVLDWIATDGFSRLGVALGHFLWQGCVVAVLYAVAARAMRGASAGSAAVPTARRPARPDLIPMAATPARLALVPSTSSADHADGEPPQRCASAEPPQRAARAVTPGAPASTVPAALPAATAATAFNGRGSHAG